MIQFDHEWLSFMRDLLPKGTKIQCSNTEAGTIERIDDSGLFHCLLKNGCRLVSAIDEGYFQISLPEQTEPPGKGSYQALKDRNQNLPKCSESHCKQRMAILDVISLDELPEWAAEILFPPLRSILALPGETGKTVEVSALGWSICRLLNADYLDRIGDCSENECVNLYFDRDAKKKGLPFNRYLHGRNYYGPILISGMHEEDRSLTDLETTRLLQLLDAPSAFQEKHMVSEINKDTFWEMIAQAKEHTGGPSEWLMEQLMDLGPEQARKFDNIACAYISLAYQYGLWTAASVMERGGCTDDGFIDFRGWLIAQGKDVYMAALTDPDSVADAPDYPNRLFDTLPRMGDIAYAELTGRSTCQDFDPTQYRALKEELKKDIVYGEGIGYPLYME